MSTTSKVTSKKMLSFESSNTIPSKKSSIITNPIELKHISNTLTNSLTMNSVLKTGLIFFTTIGGYYLAKTTGIFSYFGRNGKNSNSKDVSNSEIKKIKNKANFLTVKTNLKTIGQVNNPLTQTVTAHKDKSKAVKFDKIKIKEFKELQEMKKENSEIRRSSDRRSINVKNPIPDQNVAIGKLFNLTIDGNNVFNSNSSLFLEATYTPTWLTFSNPNPVLKGSYDMSSVEEIALFENYAYVTNDDGLLIIDISNPKNPTFKGSYNTPDTAQNVAISDNYAYITNGESGLQILDISDPKNPTFKSSYDTPDYAQGVVFFENYAYVADRGENYTSGLQIIDVSNPKNPTFKGSYNTPDDAFGVVVSGNYAYVADFPSGLQIIEITDPTNPTFKGSYNTPGQAFGVVLSDNYAYVVDGDSGLQIIDISDPINPTFKSSYGTHGIALAVTLSGNYAYVADMYLGLQIIDISNLTNPTLKDSYNTANWATTVAVSSNYAYLGDWEAGLLIIDPNLDKLTLSGTPNSIGIYLVNIKACNEAKECINDSFYIAVRNLTITLIIIGSSAGVICTASFCCSLIGCGIIALKQYRNKILKDNISINTKEEDEPLIKKKTKKFLDAI
jgi:hypothetical protein